MVSDKRAKSIYDFVKKHSEESASDYFDISLDSVRRVCRLHKKNVDENPIVGVVPDLHAPFVHPHFLEFILDTFEKWGVNKTVFIGDLVDNHAISRHTSETDSHSSELEFNLAKKEIAKWYKAFPEASFCLGNHDLIPQRQGMELGLGRHFIRSFEDTWDVPLDWKVAEDFVIGDVYYFHGTGSTGKDGAYNRAVANRMSTVQGHTHSYAGVKYHANTNDVIFGLSVGCGIDASAYAFNYGKPFVTKPVLGCGVVVSSSEAHFIPMPDKYFRSKR